VYKLTDSVSEPDPSMEESTNSVDKSAISMSEGNPGASEADISVYNPPTLRP